MNQEQLEAERAAAIAADKCFTKGRLRSEYRMKPAPDASPVAYYRGAYGSKFGVYRIAECVPLRARPQKGQVSAKQQRAAKILSVKARMRSKAAQVSAVALGWISGDGRVVDTETTGLGDDAQIIELAIGDTHGNILFKSRLRPTVSIEPEASGINGILDEHLLGAPSWPEIASEVTALLEGRSVVIFHAEYDRRLLRQTAAAFGMPDPWPESSTSRCAMHLSVSAFGATNKYGTISLAKAAAAAGVTWKGPAHSAAADVLATVDLVRSIARYRQELDAELNALQEDQAEGV